MNGGASLMPFSDHHVFSQLLPGLWLQIVWDHPWRSPLVVESLHSEPGDLCLLPSLPPPFSWDQQWLTSTSVQIPRLASKAACSSLGGKDVHLFGGGSSWLRGELVIRKAFVGLSCPLLDSWLSFLLHFSHTPHSSGYHQWKNNSPLCLLLLELTL